MEYTMSINDICEAYEETPEEISKLMELMTGKEIKGSVLEEGTVELKEGCSIHTEPLKSITVDLNLDISKLANELNTIKAQLHRI